MSLDIEQIVDRLVGRVQWVGETYSDDEALDNFNTIEYLIEHLFNQLIHNVEAERSNPNNYSAQKLGKRSKDILLYIKSDIERLELSPPAQPNIPSREEK